MKILEFVLAFCFRFYSVLFRGDQGFRLISVIWHDFIITFGRIWDCIQSVRRMFELDGIQCCSYNAIKIHTFPPVNKSVAYEQSVRVQRSKIHS